MKFDPFSLSIASINAFYPQRTFNFLEFASKNVLSELLDDNHL